MEFNREIFEKFLKNRCTDQEASAILAYFKEHPDALEHYIPIDDWLAEDKAPLNADASERILRHIRQAYEPVRRTNVRRLVIRYAVAASLIGVVVLAGMKMFTGSANPTRQVTVALTQHAGGAPELETVENKTRQVMRIRLSDSSVAVLYPNSSLQYLPSFEKDKRDLYLNGKALFRVTKNPLRPFTVYTEGIGTTVLGTRFLVTDQQNKKVSVMLMEGMVRVWSKNAADGNRSVILNPGDEVAVTGGHFGNYYLVHNVGEKRENDLAEPKVRAKNDSADALDNLVFKNNKLKDVFKKIEVKFGVTVNDKQASGVKEKLFTGKFLARDSLDFITKTICNLYGLQYCIEDGTVTITAK